MHYIIAYALALFAMCAGTYAQEAPTIYLDQGTNKITLTIRSISSRELGNTRVSVDSCRLPPWMSLEENLNNAITGTNAQVTVKLFVHDTSDNNEVLVPFSVYDDTGHSWTFNVLLKTRAGNSTETALINNFPNPFNPNTTICFSLKNDTRIKIVIYNALGQKVRTLVNGPLNAGVHSVWWNGTDENGLTLASGVYFCHFTAGGIHQTMKMVFAQ